MNMEQSRINAIAKEYFDANKDVDELYVTEDGHVFYTEAKSHMMAHCKQSKTKEHLITREESTGGEKAEKSDERIALENEAKSLGVSFRNNIGDEKLSEKIEEAKNS